MKVNLKALLVALLMLLTVCFPGVAEDSQEPALDTAPDALTAPAEPEPETAPETTTEAQPENDTEYIPEAEPEPETEAEKNPETDTGDIFVPSEALKTDDGSVLEADPESKPETDQESVMENAPETPAEDEAIPMTIEDAVLREEPDGMSVIVGMVSEGTALVVAEVVGDWALVTTPDGVSGYIHRSSVTGVTFPEIDPAAGMKVTIFTSRTAVMSPGETVTLTSLLEGFEGYEVTLYQWYCDKGNGLMPVSGANQDSYEFEASIESLSWQWQLLVRAKPIDAVD